MINNFKKAPILPYEDSKIIRRYSITSDILSYLKCPRRYGYFRARNFSPASMIQLFFGTIIHQVLDKAHLHFQGLIDPTKKGTIPSNSEIDNYFTQAKNSLYVQGIKGMSKILEDIAKKYIKRFNRQFGNILYPRVIDSEHQLRINRNIKIPKQKIDIDYILKGVVDLLVDKPGGSRSFNDTEIWDYKGVKKPNLADPNYKNYEIQMQVYAELYNFRHCVYPNKAILVFISELDGSPKKMDDIIISVPLEKGSIANAMNFFEHIVIKIEKEHKSAYNKAWSAPIKNPPDKDTCNACDLRWACDARKGQYKMKAP